MNLKVEKKNKTKQFEIVHVQFGVIILFIP